MTVDNSAAPKLRTAFTTSRLLEFCTIPELIKQVGVGTRYWPAFVVKELGDNALDICEEISVAPEIAIAISTKDGTITVSDNGPGIAPETVARLIDFHTKTSSREAYVGPTRGQQGNALQATIAMPFALDGSRGETTIEAHGVAHRIVFTIDRGNEEHLRWRVAANPASRWRWYRLSSLARDQRLRPSSMAPRSVFGGRSSVRCRRVGLMPPPSRSWSGRSRRRPFARVRRRSCALSAPKKIRTPTQLVLWGPSTPPPVKVFRICLES